MPGHDLQTDCILPKLNMAGIPFTASLRSCYNCAHQENEFRFQQFIQNLSYSIGFGSIDTDLSRLFRISDRVHRLSLLATLLFLIRQEKRPKKRETKMIHVVVRTLYLITESKLGTLPLLPFEVLCLPSRGRGSMGPL